jgi:hypothetical protein
MKPETDLSWKALRKCERDKCRKVFMPIRRHQVHCSPDCRKQAWNEARLVIRVSPVLKIEQDVRKMKRSFGALEKNFDALIAKITELLKGAN